MSSLSGSGRNSAAPDYEYHIFVSHCRFEGWLDWTKIFSATLRTLLQPAIPDVRIFVDDSIEEGVSWPIQLAQSLARSRVLVPVLSRSYFHSEWCRLELALMFERERRCGFRTPQNPRGLIFPAVIDDGDCFPQEVAAVQQLGIHEFANPCLKANTRNHWRLAEVLRERFCRTIVNAFSMVPDFDPDWESFAQDQFRNAIPRKTPPSQETVPHLSCNP